MTSLGEASSAIDVLYSLSSVEEVRLGRGLVGGDNFLINLTGVRILVNLVSEEVAEGGRGVFFALGRHVDQVDYAEQGAHDVLGPLLTLLVRNQLQVVCEQGGECGNDGIDAADGGDASVLSGSG